MHREETDKTPSISFRIIEPQQRHVFVLVILVPGPFGRRVSQVCRWRPVDISIKNGCVSDGEGSGCKVVVCSLYGEDRAGHDGIGGLLDITKRGDLW